WYDIFWEDPSSELTRKVLFAITTLITAAGYIIRVRKKITLLEIFPFFYMIPLLVFPAGKARYFFPLIPFYIFFFFICTSRIQLFQRKNAFIIIFLIAVSLNYAGRYAKADYVFLREGVEKKESIELFNFVKEQTHKNDIIIFQKPRVLALYTGRSASAFLPPEKNEDLLNYDKNRMKYLEKINATYVIAGRVLGGEHTFSEPFINRQKDLFVSVFSNADFSVYKYNPRSSAQD
ncbi:MAG: hypothetical protein ACE5FU_10570, partial [Nitrospinota bacterium]